MLRHVFVYAVVSLLRAVPSYDKFTRAARRKGGLLSETFYELRSSTRWRNLATSLTT